MVVRSCNPSTGEAEAGGSDAQVTLCYTVTSRPGYNKHIKPCSKSIKNNNGYTQLFRFLGQQQPCGKPGRLILTPEPSGI